MSLPLPLPLRPVSLLSLVLLSRAAVKGVTHLCCRNRQQAPMLQAGSWWCGTQWLRGVACRYYMAMGASKIVAEPLTITGSIGVVTGKFNLQELYRRVQYSKVVISKGK